MAQVQVSSQTNDHIALNGKYNVVWANLAASQANDNIAPFWGRVLGRLSIFSVLYVQDFLTDFINLRSIATALDCILVKFNMKSK